MHTQRGVAQQRDMDTVRAPVLRTVHAAQGVVLAQARAIADRFAQRHVLKKPKRTARPNRGERIACRSKWSAEEVAFVIPVSEITPYIHIEHAFNVGRCEVIR